MLPVLGAERFPSQVADLVGPSHLLLSCPLEMSPPRDIPNAAPGPLALGVAGIAAAAQMGWERPDQGEMN